MINRYKHGEPVRWLRRGYGWSRLENAIYMSDAPHGRMAISVKRHGRTIIKTVDADNVLPVEEVAQPA